MREIYKDFVWLHRHRDDCLISHDHLISAKERNEAEQPTTQSTLCEGERLIPGTGLLTKELKKSSCGFRCVEFVASGVDLVITVSPQASGSE